LKKPWNGENVVLERDKIVVTGRSRDVVIFVDKIIYHLARRWLFLLNLVMAVFFVGLPLLAPLLMHLGRTGSANLIYTAYRLTCHQLPHRSFFLFGPGGIDSYPLETILAQPNLPPNIQDFTGSAALGYKIAVCQRDVAIYGSILLYGLIYGLVRRWWRVKPLSVTAYVIVGLVPMGIDGITQFVGLRESTWELRVITGALFGVATGWLAYPYLDEGFREIEEQVRAKLKL
jgi:uncharacterized membrane protein